MLASITYKMMYKRLLYAGKATVLKACKDAGIDLYGHNDFCEPCVLAKKIDEILKVAVTVATRALEYVRLDLVVYDVTGYLGYLYTIYFVNVFLGYYWIKFVKDKSDYLKAIQNWLAMVKRQTSLKVKVIGLDGGIEFG